MSLPQHPFNFNNSYTGLPDQFYTPAMPTAVQDPKILLLNEKLAEDMGIDIQSFDREQLAQLLSGNHIPEGVVPIAQAYAGHQFGQFTMLGDGRAILLGEHLNPQQKRFDIQLKGAGPTGYSRRGDGRATIKAMLREYLISEAMNGLRIPTSRSLAVVTTGEKVYRQEIEDGAVLTRIMQSHIRVGSFEFVRNFLTTDDLRAYTDYTINRHFPDIQQAENPALELLSQVLLKQVSLIVNWMRVGFIHGVMNTDNMSVAGETFDYGPCAFMNAYDPATVFSSIDVNSRYAFANQPRVAHWNLSCLASALLPLIHQEQEQAIRLAEEVLNVFPALYSQQFTAMMCAKTGFADADINAEVKELIKELLGWMEQEKADYTNTFLQIQQEMEPSGIYAEPPFMDWLKKRAALLALTNTTDEAAYKLMQHNNPLLIARNHHVEKALEIVALTGDPGYFNRLLIALQQPYVASADLNEFQQPPLGGDADYATYCGT